MNYVRNIGPVEVFDGPEGTSTAVQIYPTPKGRATRAIVTVNGEMAERVKAIHETLADASYEEDPEEFELRVTHEFVYKANPLVAGISYALGNQAVLVEVEGLPGPCNVVPTPSDGAVDEQSALEHVINLVGTFAGTMGFRGFAYAGENNGKLLRAVAPKTENAGQASSQGFADDLAFHMDNANRTIPHTCDVIQADRGPMNAYQGFATVNPCSDTPMEVAALQDIVEEARTRYGCAPILELQQPNFSVLKPDSHGGGADISGVPVLVLGPDGRMHGRFHMSNVEGINSKANKALALFRSVVMETQSVMQIPGTKNGLILYSNSQCMHRRSRYVPRFDGNDRYYVRLYFAPFDVMAAFADRANGRVFV